MYCNDDCQIKDWPKHRKDCKEIQQAFLDELEEKQRALPREPKDSHK